jgi:hypothetical protein
MGDVGRVCVLLTAGAFEVGCTDSDVDVICGTLMWRPLRLVHWVVCIVLPGRREYLPSYLFVIDL